MKMALLCQSHASPLEADLDKMRLTAKNEVDFRK